jgi:hypothetical protein
MKRIIVRNETLAAAQEIAGDDKWWSAQTKEFQEKYIKDHPKSKHAKNAAAKPAAPAPAAAPAKKEKVAKAPTVKNPAPDAKTPVKAPVVKAPNPKGTPEQKVKDGAGKVPAPIPVKGVVAPTKAEKKPTGLPGKKAPVIPAPAKVEKVKPAAKRPSWPAGSKKSFEGEKAPAAKAPKAAKKDDGLLKNLNPSETGKVPVKKIKVSVPKSADIQPAAKPAPVAKPAKVATEKVAKTLVEKVKGKVGISDSKKANIEKKTGVRKEQLAGIKAKIKQLTKAGADEAKLAKFKARETFLVERLAQYKQQLKAKK